MDENDDDWNIRDTIKEKHGLERLENILDELKQSNLDRISLKSTSFPQELIKTLMSEPQTNDEDSLQRWNILGTIEIEELIMNSKNNQ